MAFEYQGFATLGVNLNRQKYGPLDISNVFTSENDLKYYLTKGAHTTGVSKYWYESADKKVVPYPYEGQVLATVIDGVVSVYVLALDAEGNFTTQEIGAKVEADDKTIKLVNGKLTLVGLPTDVSGKTFVPSLVNGVLTWAEPDTSTAEGQQQAIDGLTASVAGLGEILNGKAADEEAGTEAVVGLVDKVAALEAVDNATQAELDAYKTEVTTAIGEALQAAKDYADQNDADTKYDDTALAGRVSAIEADYLKTADKYDDTALAGRVTTIETDYLKKSDETIYDDTALTGRVTTAEGKIADLEAAVEAIDYVDADELATELAPYAKTEAVNAELAKKADKTALEALADRVDAFLTGEGTEAALDSLQELIAYIDEHDGADLTEMIATIEGIEKKLEGIDSTVVAYVTAAINALKIGDYAKAADLTALAERVEALEAKPFDTYATKTEVQNVDAKFANYTATEALNGLLADKADADSVVANDTFETFKGENTIAIGTAKSEAIAAAKTETDTQIGALEDAVATTYATKAELGEAVEGIETDLLAYAKTDDVNAELAKKADASSVYIKTEVDNKIGIPGAPAVKDDEGNVTTEAVAGTGVYQHVYSKDEVTSLIADITGGESAADVLAALNAYKTTNDTRVKAVEDVNTQQTTDIATAQAQADKGVENAAKVASDLAALGVTVADNTREIGVAKSSIETVNTTLSGKITALENADTTIKSDITALQGIVSGEDGHTSRIIALEGRATNLETRDTELAALIQSNTDKFANYSTTTQMTKAIDDRIAEIDNSALEAGIAQNAADIKANTDAISALIGEDTDKTIRAIAESEVAKIVGAAPEAFDTLQEIASWISDDASGAKAMSDAIADNAANIAALQSAVSAVSIATIDVAGLVKASETINVAEDGTMNIAKVSTDLLVQGTSELVLNGGSAK